MATRTIADGGGNYNSSGTWVEGAVPTSADDVVATATSGALTVTAAAAAKTLILTGYTNTFTINSGFTLTVSGDVTLASGMTYAGDGTLAVAATATLTANSITVSGGLSLNNGVFTITLADNWVVTGLFNVVAGSSTVTFNGSQITCNGSVTIAARLTGTTAILLAGTGTWTGSLTYGRYCSNPITIDTPGTITLATTGPFFGNNTVTYTAGTIVSTGSTVSMHTSVTLAGSWPELNSSLTVWAEGTLTVQANLTLNGTVRVLNAISLTLAGAYNYTFGTLQLDGSNTFKLPDDQTLTIATAVIAIGLTVITIRSTTASSGSTLVYNGTQANMKIAGCAFTDITATNQLWNHWGGTLTRTSGITNTSYTPGDYSDPGEAQVASGTSYLYEGATKNGTYAGGGGGLLTHPGMAGGMRG